MPFADAFSYFMTVLAIAVAPGPVVLMLLVRAAAQDVVGAVGVGIGYAVGGLLIITAVCFGLYTYMAEVPQVFDYSKYLMLAYFVYLARNIWMGSFDLTSQSNDTSKGLLKGIGIGLATCLISPYMMVLFPLVLPEVMDVTTIEMPGFLIAALMTFLALAVGSALVVIFAAQLHRIARSPRSMMLLNRGLAVVLVSGGGWMALT
ncbi:MAG: LysE family transporter [Pseudomonadota bacterium]